MKYKAISTRTRKWIYGDVHYVKNNEHFLIDVEDEMQYPVEPNTLCELVGINSLYNGDIVSIYEHLYVVMLHQSTKPILQSLIDINLQLELTEETKYQWIGSCINLNVH